MAFFKGIPAAQGVGRGPLFVLETTSLDVPDKRLAKGTSQAEWDRICQAHEHLVQDLTDLSERQEHPDVQELAVVQLMMLQDPDLMERIRKFVRRDRLPATTAVPKAFNDTIQLLKSRNVAWASERIADIAAVRDQWIRVIQQSNVFVDIPKGSILYADELSMGELLHYKEMIAGLLLQSNGPTSHAVIIAQALGIPTVTNLRFSPSASIQKGHELWMDGSTGNVILDPTPEDEQVIEDALQAYRVSNEALETIRSQPSKTSCGMQFTLRMNMELVEELGAYDPGLADGVGLYRTEALAMTPSKRTLEAQIESYRAIFHTTNQSKVTIRLFDVGSDKALPGAPKETNPALGWRGLRFLEDEGVLLQTQLEALSTVAKEFPGRCRVMIPMLSDVGELFRLKDRIEDDTFEWGVMVETPSAVWMVPELAEHVSFLSIGTNDLIQYTLAVDRTNRRVSKHFTPSHPALWRALSWVVEKASGSEVSLSVCGEMAAHPVYAQAFLGLGFGELSMQPSALAKIKQTLCATTQESVHHVAQQLVQAQTVEESMAVVDSLLDTSQG
ncbi:MAG: phosphoenolpyruvate--protein phosphotransferase [Balneolaceae bacterium]|nr:phosphoenolpyruvate--protein phosphotransferase [Balneolaceae bacterium]